MSGLDGMSLSQVKAAVSTANQRAGQLRSVQSTFTSGASHFSKVASNVGRARNNVLGGWSGQAADSASNAMDTVVDYAASSQSASQASASAAQTLAAKTEVTNAEVQAIPTVDTNWSTSVSKHPTNPIAMLSDHFDRVQQANQNQQAAVKMANSLDAAGRDTTPSFSSSEWPPISGMKAGTPPPRTLPSPNSGGGGGSGGVGVRTSNYPISSTGGGPSTTYPGGTSNTGTGPNVGQVTGPKGSRPPSVSDPTPSAPPPSGTGPGGRTSPLGPQNPEPTPAPGGTGPGRTPTPTIPEQHGSPPWGTPGSTTPTQVPPGDVPGPTGPGTGTGPGTTPISGEPGGPGAVVGIPTGDPAVPGTSSGAPRSGVPGEEPGLRGTSGATEENPRGLTGPRGMSDGEPGLRGTRGLTGSRGFSEGENYGRSGLRDGLRSGQLGNGSPLEEDRIAARRAALLGEEPYGRGFGGMGAEAGVLPAEELAGARGGAMPYGAGARRGQGNDEEEHGLPDYLQETSSIWGGDQTAAPSVIGE